MNTNRIIQGNIKKLEYVNNTYKSKIFLGEEEFEFIYTLKERIIKTEQKVILVKYSDHAYIELCRLNSLKNLIKSYYELLFVKVENRDLLLSDDYFNKNDMYVDRKSIENFNSLNKNESIKSLQKKLLK